VRENHARRVEITQGIGPAALEWLHKGCSAFHPLCSAKLFGLYLAFVHSVAEDFRVKHKTGREA
jgi:hypothetical protein